MIGKVLRGRRVDRLLWYLYGPGKANEHVNPHLVAAGFEHPAALEPPIRPNGGRDFRRLTRLLTQHVEALKPKGFKKPVWHCVARAAPEDRILSDDEWADIAHTIMDRTGLARYDDPGGVPWVAVRHADDHIHIVATLARQDGTKPKLWNDWYRIGEACREVEARYGLRITAPRDRTAAHPPSRAEAEQARRHGRQEAPRAALRRDVITAAASAGNEQDFFAALERSGVRIKMRFSQMNASEVIGYAVGLKDHTAANGEQIWFGGGKLAADLTLPKLRRRWRLSDSAVRGGPRPDGASTPGHSESTRGARAVLRVAARKAAAQSINDREFFARLDQAGIVVRPRLSERTPGEITGYSVGLPGHEDANGQQVWYSGGKLADDLTLPKLRHRWHNGGAGAYTDSADLTVEERMALWDHAAYTARTAAERIRTWSESDPAAAADAAWAASDTLHVAARALRSRPLRLAADAYDRAARQPYGRIPPASFTGSRLRTAARLLALAGAADRKTLASIRLITNLAALASTVGDLRQIQQRAAQAAGARAAAEHLHTAAPPPTSGSRLPDATPRPRRTDARGLSLDDFPTGPRPPQPPTRPRSPGADRPGRRRGPEPRPPRGPRR